MSSIEFFERRFKHRLYALEMLYNKVFVMLHAPGAVALKKVLVEAAGVKNEKVSSDIRERRVGRLMQIYRRAD
jgi:hypothetical protein